MKSLLTLLSFFWLCPTFATERIVWIVPDWPASELPESKPSAPLTLVAATTPASPPKLVESEKENGFIRLAKEISDNLPEYEHHYVVGNVDKAIRLWKEKRRVCVLPALTTEDRQELAYFTAFTLVPPYRFVVPSNKASSFQVSRERVDIRGVLENKSIRGAVIQDRSYGAVLDAVLKRQAERVLWAEPLEDWMAVMSMVQNGRVDYTIEFAEYVRYFNLKNTKGATLVSLPLSEMPTSLPSFIGCTKDEWGKKVIEMIDKKMQKLVQSSSYQKSMEALFSSESEKSYKEDLQQFFEKRAVGNWIF